MVRVCPQSQRKETFLLAAVMPTESVWVSVSKPFSRLYREQCQGKGFRGTTYE